MAKSCSACNRFVEIRALIKLARKAFSAADPESEQEIGPGRITGGLKT
jgi:hypothetical protein